jgi:hypothetical protein
MRIKTDSITIKKTACLFIFAILIVGNKLGAQENILTQPGNFVVGCNYWASHAGTGMWSDWRPEVVDKDFQQLSENGITVIRIFPLWPDFQPIVQLYGAKGTEKGIAFADGPLPPTGAGADGMSEAALEKFQVAADLAEKHHIKMIVGLINGWMSGQLFVPPALQGKNVLTDATALNWEHKFVKTFVHRFKSHPAIVGWDLGNECNVMGNVDDFNQAYVWSALLSGAIKSEDTTRPVVSGMHSLSPADGASWRIKDQAETTDLLTTHPYPIWTRYAGLDPINTMRALLHSAAETRMYADIGGKPCLIEETGTMGPMIADDAVAAAFARTLLFSGWANDCHGVLWWCAFDQDRLNHTPYSWVAAERNLGLIRDDRSAKPVLSEFKNFNDFLQQLPFKTLPPRKTEAVCVLTEGQDNWAAAYGSFILAKQAGFDLEFQKAGQTLKDAPVYLVPSIGGGGGANINRADWLNLLEKVKQGASLYVSIEGGFVSPLVEPFGLDIVVNSIRNGPASFISTNLGGNLTFNLPAPWKTVIRPKRATVLATEADGNPIFTETSYGNGKLYLLSLPLETDLAKTPEAFNPSQPGYYRIYREIAQAPINRRVLTQSNPYIAATEHSLSSHEKVIVLVNYNPVAVDSTFQLKPGWMVSRSLHGELPTGNRLTIKPNDALVLMVEQR